MIPLKLQLKNFISYGSQLQTVDFEPHHLICLSGKNGHGKSALLDAITWALWGQARKVGTSSKPDEGVMRLGQTQMMVVLDFMANGTVYRVRREFGINRSKATTNLDFGIVDSASNEMKPLTDKTIRATQEKICQTIGLDYDAFTNSAFLRQGQSNEFTKKSSRERKEVLASILGLDRYESLRKLASDKARNYANQKDLIHQALEGILEELNNKEHIESQLSTITAALTSHAQDELALNNQAQTIHISKQALATDRDALTRLSTLKIQAHHQVNELRTLLEKKVARFRSVLRYQKKMTDWQTRDNERTIYEQKLAELGPRLELYRALRNEIQILKTNTYSAREKLMHEHSKNIHELTRELSICESTLKHTTLSIQTTQKNIDVLNHEKGLISQEISKIEMSISRAQSEEIELARYEKAFDRRKSFFQKFAAQGNFLTKELSEHSEKQDLLQKASATCPLCDQCLDEKRSWLIAQRLDKAASRINHQIARLTNVTKDLKQQLLQEHELLKTKRKSLEDNRTLASRILDYKKRLDTISAAEKEQSSLLAMYSENSLSLQKKLQDLMGQQRAMSLEVLLTNNTEYQSMITKLQLDEKTLQEFAHDEQLHHDISSKLNQLLKESSHHQQLLTEIALQQERKKEVSEIIIRIRILQKEIAHYASEMDQFSNYENILNDLQLQEIALVKQRSRLQESKEELSRKKGALENSYTVLLRKEQDSLAQRQKIQEFNDLSIEYHAIAQALSKDGIQALLIEEAIPEIEQEANNLLAKLTDNQAHLTIESLRDLKSGATKETLDIKISDPLGIRPYEMFSGGEAFRIDFALRIAISKLLARRAGATLQLLIIDEGFGSQDEEGLNHIMEALYKIQDDFAKIIIVSHLPSMKDQFPVHFVVHKSPQGSVITVTEQG